MSVVVAGEAKGAGFALIEPGPLAELRSDPALLVLDVRRRAAFVARMEGIPGAVALLLDVDPLRIPDAPFLVTGE